MTTYLRRLYLMSDSDEIRFITNLKRTCYNGVYPFKIFPMKELSEIDFAPITVFYGGNGSGKTTLLNIIAEKVGVQRHSPFSSGAFFSDYVRGCRTEGGTIPAGSEILTSDDVFDLQIDLRHLNDGIDRRRDELFDEFMDRKYSKNRLTSLSDYETWREGYDAKTKTQSRFVKDRLMKNADMHSNGESAFRYFFDHITENALYLLDEPENSLSVPRQIELGRFISDSARFYRCQFIIATHSPVLLSMERARIYDLDSLPVQVKPWTELENVRRYYEFFRDHSEEFENKA